MSSVNKSILLVDDDQEIRELLDTYLSRAGFQVRTTPDGAGFRQALNEAPSDLVILDVMLPDGADFALLKLFLDHPQEILDRDTIGNATRGRDLMPLDRIVDMAVSRLRQRLRDTDKPPRLIRTVRGSGYQLAANVVAGNAH